MEFKDYGPLVESHCPECGIKLDAAGTFIGQGQPEEGDFSICINCGQFLRFQADLRLRRATAGDIREMMADRRAWRTMEKAQQEIRKRGPLP